MSKKTNKEWRTFWEPLEEILRALPGDGTFRKLKGMSADEIMDLCLILNVKNCCPDIPRAIYTLKLFSDCE